ALVGGGDAEDLDRQMFDPGRETLTEDGLRKLDRLAEALRQRPALNLAITGECDPAADAVALRPSVLEARLREQARPEDLTAEGGWVARARDRALVNLYIQEFGEPPIDPAAAVPAPSEAAPTLSSAGPAAAADPADETLL